VPEAIATALAGLRQPDLSQFSPEQIQQAMKEMFGGQGLKPEWLAWLRARIDELSGHRTALMDADRAEFPWLSKEWGAVYQRLTGEMGDQLVIIGNSMPPFLFVPHK
jgi:hypothetical protein